MTRIFLILTLLLLLSLAASTTQAHGGGGYAVNWRMLGYGGGTFSTGIFSADAQANYRHYRLGSIVTGGGSGLTSDGSHYQLSGGFLAGIDWFSCLGHCGFIPFVSKQFRP